MCLLVLAYRAHSRYPLILAGNRDEFLDRPTRPAMFWPDRTNVLAGQDLRAGGTWLGVTTHGRVAALTNHRDARRPAVNGRSRGLLVLDALDGAPVTAHTAYDGYNLIHGTIDRLWYGNNVQPWNEELGPGIHTLSNALLNTPWPKAERARAGFTREIQRLEPSVNALFELLDDPTLAPDHALPDTGVGLVWERALSAIKIATPAYATRCSTVILVDLNGRVRFEERDHSSGNIARFSFELRSEGNH